MTCYLTNKKLTLFVSRSFDPHTPEDPEDQQLIDQRLIDQYWEAEAQRDNTNSPPLVDSPPDARYVEIAFEDTSVIDTGSPYQDINALVRHIDSFTCGKKDLSEKHKDIAWVRLMTCVRILSRLECWPYARPDHQDSDTTKKLRRRHISIQDFILRIEIVSIYSWNAYQRLTK